MFLWMMFSDFTMFPVSAAHVDIAEDQENDSVDMFGSPADGDVEFHDADNYGAI
jgi:hypothetical protein